MSDIRSIFKLMRSDHEAWLHGIANKLALDVSEDLKDRSTVPATVVRVSAPDLSPRRRVKHSASKNADDKLLAKTKEAQDHVIETLRNDKDVQWRLRKIGVY